MNQPSLRPLDLAVALHLALRPEDGYETVAEDSEESTRVVAWINPDALAEMRGSRPSRTMATRERLHRLIEELPDGDVPAATEALERLRMARGRRALANAPVDDEPLTEAERQAIEEAEEDLRRGERPIPMDEVKRRLGIA